MANPYQADTRPRSTSSNRGRRYEALHLNDKWLERSARAIYTSSVSREVVALGRFTSIVMRAHESREAHDLCAIFHQLVRDLRQPYLSRPTRTTRRRGCVAVRKMAGHGARLRHQHLCRHPNPNVIGRVSHDWLRGLRNARRASSSPIGKAGFTPCTGSGLEPLSEARRWALIHSSISSALRDRERQRRRRRAGRWEGADVEAPQSAAFAFARSSLHLELADLVSEGLSLP